MPTNHTETLIFDAVKDLKERDEELYKELFGQAIEGVANTLKALFQGRKGVASTAIHELSIVLAKGRPVFSIQGDKFTPQFADGKTYECKFWQQHLTTASDLLTAVIPAVGRLAVKGHPHFSWVGTGWLVGDCIVVTNRHVALEFAMRGKNSFVFRPSASRNEMQSSIDFLEEVNRIDKAEFKVKEIMWIEPEFGPDLAFLRVAPGTAKLPNPIPLGDAAYGERESTYVATIGYPARDSRIPDQELVVEIFGDIYNKKRLAPGKITKVTSGWELHHDCSTLGGNSGSAIISLDTGEALGLHFAGQYLRTNFAVKSTIVAKCLKEAVNGNAIELSATSASPEEHGSAKQKLGTSTVVKHNITQHIDGTDATWVIPLEVTVRVGSPASPLSLQGLNPMKKNPSKTELDFALRKAQEVKAGRDDVVDVREGYRFRNGWITDEQALVFAVRQKMDPEELQARGIAPLPSEISGVGVDVTTASPSILEGDDAESLALLEKVPKSGNYKMPPDLKLKSVRKRMKGTVHVSPDSGCRILSGFLGDVRKTLTVGMYEFTAAYIFEALKRAVKPKDRKLNLVIQRFENNAGDDDVTVTDIVRDLKTDLGNRFKHAWAAVSGPTAIFPGHYHIKVAVRDGEAFWLSSGNWKPSGQPEKVPDRSSDGFGRLLRSKNREWHVVLQCRELARQFEDYLLYDLEQAKDVEAAPVRVPEVFVPLSLLEAAFEVRVVPPTYPEELALDEELDVQPLLTPDNYAEHVLKLITSAKRQIYFQNQSLSPLLENMAGFQKLLEALKEKQRDGLDVRIIFRDASEFGGGADRIRKSIEKLKCFGFDTSHVRVQRGCHTKGMIVDGTVALLGSHNWTNDGTLHNRDASLIFRNQKVAQYLEEVFLFDWQHMSHQKLDEKAPPLELAQGLESKPDMVRIPITELYG